jgi:tetratricopeptide (TPR) repeat protein
MANFLVSHSPSSITIAHFLEAAVNEVLTKSVSVAASIVLQLFREKKIQANHSLTQRMIDTVLPLLDHFTTYEECPFDRLWAAIDSFACELPPFTLVIDGLDECYAGGDAPALIARLQQLSTLSHARVIVLSRYHPWLQELLQDSVQIKMDEDAISDDISLFIRNVLERTPKIRIPHDEILEKARKHAKGMFIWADLMLKYLEKGSTRKMQRARLEKFPIGLSPIYEKLLKDVGENMDDDQRSLRKKIFMLLVAASVPLSPDDVAAALALEEPDMHPDTETLLIDPKYEISVLCWPFTKVVGDRVQFVHYSMQEFLLLPNKNGAQSKLHFTLQQSSDYMALKCMYRLINPDARSVKVLEPLLRSHMLGTPSTLPSASSQLPIQWPFYAYACTGWYIHLAQSSGSMSLLRNVSMFLRDAHFIAWVESLLTVDTDVGPVVAINAALCTWHASLNDTQRRCITITDFMGKAYNDFYARVEIMRKMPEVAFMALRRLGLYHNMNGTKSGGRTLIELRKLVAEGFTTVLGERHPLTLRSTTEWCIERLVDDDRQLLAGEALLLRTLELQREVVGLDVSDSFYTQLYAGRALYFRARFDEALQHLEECYQGLERTLGPNHQHSQIARLFHTYAVEGKLDHQKASQTYEDIWQAWSKVQGTHHPLAVAVECNLGVVNRKMKNYDLAEKYLVHSFAERQRLFGKCSVTVDGSIQLALLYRDMGRMEEAQAYLELAEEVGLKCNGFERHCQVQHLQALLHLDGGNLASAREVLERLLSESSRHPPNRALLWVRLTLADILRVSDNVQKASLLFTNIVKPMIALHGIEQPIDTNMQLCAAEQFLRVAREIGVSVAEEQLKLLGLEWCSPEGFWIIFGGPAAEVYYEGAKLIKG